MRASDRAYALLLDEIQRGLLAPGTVLGEVEQADRLGISRTPVREALGRLIADGLVAQQSPRIIVVTDFDARDVRSLFETRRALEETAARLAAGRGDRAVFRALAEAFDRAGTRGAGTNTAGLDDAGFDDAGFDDADGIDAYYALIADFDAALDAAVDNGYLAAALRTVRTHLARARRLARDNPDRLQASVTEHRLIASAIAAGDAELAAHATHIHLHNALTSILSSLSEGTP